MAMYGETVRHTVMETYMSLHVCLSACTSLSSLSSYLVYVKGEYLLYVHMNYANCGDIKCICTALLMENTSIGKQWLYMWN